MPKLTQPLLDALGNVIDRCIALLRDKYPDVELPKEGITAKNIEGFIQRNNKAPYPLQQILAALALAFEFQSIGMSTKSKLKKYFPVIDHGQNSWVPFIDDKQPEISLALIDILIDELSKLGKTIMDKVILGWGPVDLAINEVLKRTNPNDIFLDYLHSLESQKKLYEFTSTAKTFSATHSVELRQKEDDFREGNLGKTTYREFVDEITGKLVGFVDEITGKKVKFTPMGVVPPPGQGFAGFFISRNLDPNEIVLSSSAGNLAVFRNFLHTETATKPEEEQYFRQWHEGQYQTAEFDRLKKEVLGAIYAILGFIKTYSGDEDKRQILNTLKTELVNSDTNLTNLEKVLSSVYSDNYFEYFDPSYNDFYDNSIKERAGEKTGTYLSDASLQKFFSKDEINFMERSPIQVWQTAMRNVSFQGIMLRLFLAAQKAVVEHNALCARKGIATKRTGHQLEELRNKIVEVLVQVGYSNDPSVAAYARELKQYHDTHAASKEEDTAAPKPK